MKRPSGKHGDGDGGAEHRGSLRPAASVPATAPVAAPVAVWLLDGGAHTGSEISEKLARRLVQIYTARGETVIAWDDDPHLARAAVAAGRGYVSRPAVGTGAERDSLDGAGTPGTLVLCQWRLADATSAARLGEMLVVCRPSTWRANRVMVMSLITVGAFWQGGALEPGAALELDLEQAAAPGLSQMAASVGFLCTHRLVVVHGDPAGDVFCYPASGTDSEMIRDALSGLPDSTPCVVFFSLTAFGFH